MKKLTLFVAPDGTRFESKREAEQHEAFLSFKADFAEALKSRQPVDEAAQALWQKHLAPAAKAKVATPPAASGQTQPNTPPPLALAS